MDKRNFKILVADDDEIARDVICTLLEQEGYAVSSATDGLDAINRLRSGDFHFVLSDLKMPGADGIDVLKYAIRMIPDIAVVILTAYGTLDTTLEAMKEGAYGYLTKPFKTQEIVVLANRVFSRAQLIADNRDLKQELRATYRDLELIRTVAEGANPEVTTGWIERIERLRAMNVLEPHEADVLKERLIQGNASGRKP